MNLFNILQGTPYWVWILFAYLLMVGISALKSRSMPWWRFAIIPLIFTVWSLFSIYNKCTTCPLLFCIWLAALTIGTIGGYYLMNKTKFTIDAPTKLIHIPGSFIPLLLSISFFSIKYIFGVAYAINPLLNKNMFVLGIDIFLSGIICGIFLGRLIGILYQYQLVHKKN